MTSQQRDLRNALLEQFNSLEGTLAQLREQRDQAADNDSAQISGQAARAVTAIQQQIWAVEEQRDAVLRALAEMPPLPPERSGEGDADEVGGDEPRALGGGGLGGGAFSSGSSEQGRAGLDHALTDLFEPSAGPEAELSLTRRSQVVIATGAANASDGFIQPSVCRGRPLSSRATASRCL